MKKKFKNKTKGFTLVEILATIIIMAVIVLIASPVVLNIIDDVRKDSFVTNSNKILEVVNNEYITNDIKLTSTGATYIFEDGILTSEDKIKFSGQMPQNGIIQARSDGKIAMAINDGTWCVRKNYDSSELSVEKLNELLKLGEYCGIEGLSSPILTNRMIECLVLNDCAGVTLPAVYLGTEGTWVPISTLSDIQNIDKTTLYTFAVGTQFEKLISAETLDQRLDRKYILINNIDILNQVIDPIGHDTNWTTKDFTGILDGNNRTVSNAIIDDPTEVRLGFVAYVTTGIIRNLRLENFEVEGYSVTGALIGTCTGCTVNNVHVNANVVGNENLIGGLIGINESGQILNSSSSGTITSVGTHIGGLTGISNGVNALISNSHSTASVSGLNRVGGLTGILSCDVNLGSSIVDSYATGTITGTEVYIGGLVGMQTCGFISKSYATGNVYTPAGYVGGLVGQSEEYIEKSYATGNVEGFSYVGGLVGNAWAGDDKPISNSYATGTVTGEFYLGGLTGRANEKNIDKCYTTSTIISHDGGVGGISGVAVNDASSTKSISNSYALNNEFVRTAGSADDFHRVVGYQSAPAMTLVNNYGNQDMIEPFTNAFNNRVANGLDGLDVISKPLQSHYVNNSSWDFTTIWIMGPNGYPIHR